MLVVKVEWGSGGSGSQVNQRKGKASFRPWQALALEAHKFSITWRNNAHGSLAGKTSPGPDVPASPSLLGRVGSGCCDKLEDRAQGIPRDSIKCGWRNRPEWGGQGREALVLATVSLAALPLRWVTLVWPPCTMTRGGERHSCREEPRLLEDPRGTNSGRGSLWSCDWPSHSELHCAQKDPREGDHFSWPSAH